MWTTRPKTDADHDVLWRLFLMQMPPTLRTQGQDILSLFFKQTTSQFDTHTWHIIEIGAQAVGQLVLAEGDTPHVVNLALLPSHQNMGFGSSVIRQLQSTHTQLRLDITTSHRARNLLERLGFERQGIDADIEQWVWHAEDDYMFHPAKYEALVGETFQVVEYSIDLILLEVERLPVLTQHDAAMLNPFAIMWLGPSDPFLNQQTITIQHPQIGEVSLFIVPRAQRDDGFVYEAIIN